MKIRVIIDAFKEGVKIEGIDAGTLSFYGPTDGYPYPESKKYDHSGISFVAENAIEQVEKIKLSFQRNPEYFKVEDYIRVRTEFKDYEKDKRPRIYIRLDNGAQGMRNPPEFHIKNE